MRNALIVAVAVMAFGLGAWISPNLKAESQDDVPVLPKTGDTVTLHAGLNSACLVESVASEARGWIRCNGVWWNLMTGAGYSVRSRQ